MREMFARHCSNCIALVTGTNRVRNQCICAKCRHFPLKRCLYRFANFFVNNLSHFRLWSHKKSSDDRLICHHCQPKLCKCPISDLPIQLYVIPARHRYMNDSLRTMASYVCVLHNIIAKYTVFGRLTAHSHRFATEYLWQKVTLHRICACQYKCAIQLQRRCKKAFNIAQNGSTQALLGF